MSREICGWHTFRCGNRACPYRGLQVTSSMKVLLERPSGWRGGCASRKDDWDRIPIVSAGAKIPIVPVEFSPPLTW